MSTITSFGANGTAQRLSMQFIVQVNQAFPIRARMRNKKLLEPIKSGPMKRNFLFFFFLTYHEHFLFHSVAYPLFS